MATRRKIPLLPLLALIALVLFISARLPARQAPPIPEIFNQTLGVRLPHPSRRPQLGSGAPSLGKWRLGLLIALGSSRRFLW